MIDTTEALNILFSLAAPVAAERVDLAHANGRTLAEDVVAHRAQPPFAASAMDGYALRHADQAAPCRVIGEAPAGRAFVGTVGTGEAVRIFTGAPMPEGADTVVIQEDTQRDGTQVRVVEVAPLGANIRPAGNDFAPGDRISAPRCLGPSDLALAAAMNAAHVTVRRRPKLALIATGDELVMPGEAPRDDQIIASNAFGLKALFEDAGAAVRLLPIARDTPASLRAALALAEGADLIVTIGGASVGDHDLVGPVAQELGMELGFYKVAMRPGKPLMAGRLGASALVGLPGNPVSALVCGHIFVVPMLRAMLGHPPGPAPRITARLGAAIGANGPREHYMRAVLEGEQITPFERQDSSLLSILTRATALLVRPPGEAARAAGDIVEAIVLRQD